MSALSATLLCLCWLQMAQHASTPVRVVRAVEHAAAVLGKID
jgi:hypothetical protein